MVHKPTQDIKDIVTREHIESLQAETQENIIELSAAPTATTPLLLDNQKGSFENIKYERVGNTIFVFTPGSTITVT